MLELRHSLWPLRLAFILSSADGGFAQVSQTIKIVAVAQSADFQPGIANPGSLNSIFVTGLAGEPGIITATAYPLSNQLNGVSVSIDSYPAPILALALFNGNQQINVQVPWEDSSPKVVAVTQNGIQAQTSDSAGTPWSVFFSAANGYGVIQHASDYSLVTPQNPAHPDEYLIAYAQNLGSVTNQPATGAPAPFNPLAESVLGSPVGCDTSVSVRFGPNLDFAASPSYMGLTPGAVGVYQVNFQLPTSMQAGDSQIALMWYQAGSAFFHCMNNGITSRSVLLPIQ